MGPSYEDVETVRGLLLDTLAHPEVRYILADKLTELDRDSRAHRVRNSTRAVLPGVWAALDSDTLLDFAWYLKEAARARWAYSWDVARWFWSERAGEQDRQLQRLDILGRQLLADTIRDSDTILLELDPEEVYASLCHIDLTKMDAIPTRPGRKGPPTNPREIIKLRARQIRRLQNQHRVLGLRVTTPNGANPPDVEIELTTRIGPTWELSEQLRERTREILSRAFPGVYTAECEADWF